MNRYNLNTVVRFKDVLISVRGDFPLLLIFIELSMYTMRTCFILHYFLKYFILSGSCLVACNLFVLSQADFCDHQIHQNHHTIDTSWDPRWSEQRLKIELTWRLCYHLCTRCDIFTPGTSAVQSEKFEQILTFPHNKY